MNFIFLFTDSSILFSLLTSVLICIVLNCFPFKSCLRAVSIWNMGRTCRCWKEFFSFWLLKCLLICALFYSRKITIWRECIISLLFTCLNIVIMFALITWLVILLFIVRLYILNTFKILQSLIGKCLIYHFVVWLASNTIENIMISLNELSRSRFNLLFFTN